MSLTLVVPGLLALPPASLARCRALASLARLARVDTVPDGLDAAVLHALGLDMAIAPLVALGAGLDPGDDGWLCADPVVLVAGHEDVRLVGRVDDLAPDEAAAISARLNRHFVDDGVVFEVPRPDRWLLRVRGRALPHTTTLARAQDVPLRGLLPSGPDAPLWRRWQNEIQMLLHEDPVNEARIAAGAAAVSGIWFWGEGRASPPDVTVDASVPHGREADLLRGLVRLTGRDPSPLPDKLPAIGPGDACVMVMLPAPVQARGLDLQCRDWLGPAIAAVERGELRSLALVGDAGCAAAIWHAEPPSLIARLRSHWSQAPFSLPPALSAHDGETRR